MVLYHVVNQFFRCWTNIIAQCTFSVGPLRGIFTSAPIKSNSSLLAVCDKSKMQLSHVLGKNLAMSFNQIGHDIPNIIDTVIAGKSAGF
ncbi:hypothetical protein BD769DRAFT_1666810 [Suillus cothurnatus]|nr:hypothetical protein BD769DRAFT_1666810 [Suillus cothurnatus]